MSTLEETTIRVPIPLRDHIKHEAAKRGVKQAALIELALRELEQAEFLRAVSAVEWDDAARAEASEWDEADLATLDPWKPHE